MQVSFENECIFTKCTVFHLNMLQPSVTAKNELHDASILDPSENDYQVGVILDLLLSGNLLKSNTLNALLLQCDYLNRCSSVLKMVDFLLISLGKPRRLFVLIFLIDFHFKNSIVGSLFSSETAKKLNKDTGSHLLGTIRVEELF